MLYHDLDNFIVTSAYIYICITWMCGFAGRGDNPLGMRNWLAELKIQASLLYRLSHA